MTTPPEPPIELPAKIQITYTYDPATRRLNVECAGPRRYGSLSSSEA